AIPELAPPPPRGEAGDHLPVADLRAQPAGIQRVDAARPRVHQAPIVRHRREDPCAHAAGGGFSRGGLLIRVKPSAAAWRWMVWSRFVEALLTSPSAVHSFSSPSRLGFALPPSLATRAFPAASVGFATAVALALRIFLLGHQSLWVDEYLTWHTANVGQPLPFS